MAADDEEEEEEDGEEEGTTIKATWRNDTSENFHFPLGKQQQKQSHRRRCRRSWCLCRRLRRCAALRCAAVRMSRCHKCRRWNYAANNENTLYKKWQTIKSVQRTWESGRDRQTERGRGAVIVCVCVCVWSVWSDPHAGAVNGIGNVDCGIAVTNTIVFVSESMSQSVDGDCGQSGKEWGRGEVTQCRFASAKAIKSCTNEFTSGQLNCTAQFCSVLIYNVLINTIIEKGQLYCEL